MSLENISLQEPIEGYLQKFTNLMKGYQFRWFVLNPASGMLEYYLSEQEFREKQKPRNAIYLGEAVIVPSEEDSFTFLINANAGEIFKIKANDAKERQYWVNQLRSIAQYHHNSDKISSSSSLNLPNVTKCNSSSNSTDFFNNLFSFDLLTGNLPTSKKYISQSKSHDQLPSSKISVNKIQNDSHIKAAKEILRLSEKHYKDMKDIIEGLPQTNEGLKFPTHQRNNTLTNLKEMNAPPEVNEINCKNANMMGPLDPDLLLLKATGFATLNSLQTCLNALEYRYSTNHINPNLLQNNNYLVGGDKVFFSAASKSDKIQSRQSDDPPHSPSPSPSKN